MKGKKITRAFKPLALCCSVLAKKSKWWSCVAAAKLPQPWG